MVEKIVPQEAGHHKGRETTLSSLAYFPASPNPALKHRLKANPNPAEYPAMKAARIMQPAQNRRIAHDKPVHVAIHHDMIKVTTPDYANGKNARPGGDRGTVKGFSRASRKRMIEFMSSIRGDNGDMYFVTMTYDDWSWLRKPDDHTRDFEAFRKRFERAFPNWRAIWRVEVKTRLSGELTGCKVPHFHLLIFSGRHDDEETKTENAEGLSHWGVENWGEIVRPENPAFKEYGFHVGAVKSRRHAYSYVSKYIGKVDDDHIAAGRRWGRIGKFDTSPSETVILAPDEAQELKRLIRRWLRSKHPAAPASQSAKDIKKWHAQIARARAFASRFASFSSGSGFTAFGIGDGAGDITRASLMHSAAQFIYAAKDIARAKRLTEIA